MLHIRHARAPTDCNLAHTQILPQCLAEFKDRRGLEEYRGFLTRNPENLQLLAKYIHQIDTHLASIPRQQK